MSLELADAKKTSNAYYLLPDNNEFSAHKFNTESQSLNKMDSMIPAEPYNKWWKLITNVLFLTRIFLLILALILLFLASSYCIAQLLQAKLDLITVCPERKTRKEIWRHSYESSLKYDDDHKLNEESQYGLTDEPCWTTNKVDINTKQLWYSNTYIYEWKLNVNAKFVLFAIITFYCLLIVIFIITSLIIDIIHVLQNTLHTKFNPHPRNNNKWRQFRVSFTKLYTKYFHVDSTGWIIRKYISDIFELTLQSQALLFYNGYYILDPNNKDDTYLANKREFINLFAGIISFNCFGSAILWLFYLLIPGYCFGIKFKRCWFFIDKFSDFLYVIFPIIMLSADDYNTNTGDWFVLLAQLNINSTLGFCATFIPLLLLCNQCLWMNYESMNKMRKQYFEQWKAIVSTPKYLKSNWIHKTTQNTILKRFSLVFMIMTLFGYGLFIIIFVTQYTKNANIYCQSIQESVFYENEETISLISAEQTLLLQTNPELFLWDKCLYKVYPFVNDKKYKCQCRIFVIEDWLKLQSSYNDRALYFNLTQQQMINGMLQNWFMLEKFKTNGNGEPVYVSYEFNTSMYNARYMKAFEWTYAQITNFQNGISYWSALEYFKLEETLGVFSLPNDMNKLQNMKVLSVIESGLRSFPKAICNMTQLLKLEMVREYNIDPLPFCISNLVLLKEIILVSRVNSIPLEIFTMPNLIDLSLYNANISYQALLKYNLPSYIDINDTNSTYSWFNDNFNWNRNATFWLQSNPICNESKTLLPYQLTTFLSSNQTKCENLCIDEYNPLSSFCSSQNWGDGRCNEECNFPGCGFDGGDCIQLCFSDNSDLSNCSWELFTNNQCDEGCDNKYCIGYFWKSDFQKAFYAVDESSNYTDLLAADNLQCPGYQRDVKLNITKCKKSNSSYIDMPPTSDLALISFYWYGTTNIDATCHENMVNDGMCHDQCRTEECLYDGTDCNLQCVDDDCFGTYRAWTMFAGPNVYNAAHDVICNKWLSENAWIDIAFGSDSNQCKLLIVITDFNNDKYMNFREFTFFTSLWGSDGEDNLSRAIGANCSQCVGVQNYNVKF